MFSLNKCNCTNYRLQFQCLLWNNSNICCCFFCPLISIVLDCCSQKHQCFLMILLGSAALFECIVRSDWTLCDWLVFSCNICVCSDEQENISILHNYLLTVYSSNSMHIVRIHFLLNKQSLVNKTHLSIDIFYLSMDTFDTRISIDISILKDRYTHP